MLEVQTTCGPQVTLVSHRSFSAMANPPSIDPVAQPLQVQQAILSHAIGTCLMAWANVEHILHEMFVRQVVFQSRNKNRFVVARSIWSVIISFEARLKMVDASINANLWHAKTRRSQQLSADWRLLKNYVTKMSSLRNEIAHGTIMNRDNQEMIVTPYATSIPFRGGISIAEIGSRTKPFLELHDALRWLEFLSSTWKPKLTRAVLNQRPTPDLMVMLRRQAAGSRKGKKGSRKPSHGKPAKRSARA